MTNFVALTSLKRHSRILGRCTMLLTVRLSSSLNEAARGFNMKNLFRANTIHWQHSGNDDFTGSSGKVGAKLTKRTQTRQKRRTGQGTGSIFLDLQVEGDCPRHD